MGGIDDSDNILSSVELFPRPPSSGCSVPDLPRPRSSHSLSLLSGGRLVVCGGYDGSSLNSCISWVVDNTTWTPFHNMRCLNHIFHTNQNPNSQHSEISSHSVDAALSPQHHHPAWRLGWRCNSAHSRDRARWLQAKYKTISVLQEEKPLSCVTVELVPVGFLTGIAL